MFPVVPSPTPEQEDDTGLWRELERAPAASKLPDRTIMRMGMRLAVRDRLRAETGTSIGTSSQRRGAASRKRILVCVAIVSRTRRLSDTSLKHHTSYGFRKPAARRSGTAPALPSLSGR